MVPKLLPAASVSGCLGFAMVVAPIVPSETTKPVPLLTSPPCMETRCTGEMVTHLQMDGSPGVALGASAAEH